MEHRGFERHEFHGRDVHHFHEHDLAMWRGGRWNNTCFAGRCGWWWFAGGSWYFYERPIYPYPLIVSEGIFIEPAPPVIVAPAAPIVVQPAPPPVAPTPTAPAPQFWYYCDNPAGYYPYVQNCNGSFRPVPVTPQ